MVRLCLPLVVAAMVLPPATVAARVPTAPDPVSSFFLGAEKPLTSGGSRHVGMATQPILLQEQQHANADNTTLIIGVCVVVLVLVLVGVAVWFKRRQASASPEEGTEIEGAAPDSLTEPLKGEAAAAPELEDYESLFKKMMQKGAQQIGPKLEKGAEVRNIVESKIESLKGKAKALVMSELNDAAGSVCRALEVEESMLLLDWDAAVAANFPPLSILVAGLLVPTTLAISKVSHIAQILIVQLPVMCLCLVSEYLDWNHPCLSIPGIRQWAQATGILTMAITVSRLVMFVRTSAAEKDLKGKSDEMKARLTKVEEHTAAAGGRGLADIRELFICHSTMLQYAVVCEDRTRASFFNHIVGFGTLLWLGCIGWVTFITSRYTFVPGVVAFHPAAADDPAYCAAWMTVIAARISVLLGTLFFFVNVFTVIGWVLETSLNAGSSKIENKAKEIDGTMMGIPVVQFLVKSFLFRGKADVLSARLAVAFSEKSALAKDYADNQARLGALKAQIAAKDAQMQTLEKEVALCGGTLEDQANHFSTTGLDIESLRKQGNDVIDERKRRAMIVEEATTEEIDKLVEKIRALATSIEQSESFQAAEKMSKEGYDKASAAAQDAAAMAQDAAKNIQESEQFKKAQAGIADAQRTLQDPELMKKAQAAGQDAFAQAQGAASSAAEALQDPELQKKVQAGLDQARGAAASAADAIQDPELMKKAQEGLAQAKVAAASAADAIQDPELMKKAQATAQSAADQAKAAASQAKGQVEKAAKGKKK